MKLKKKGIFPGLSLNFLRNEERSEFSDVCIGEKSSIYKDEISFRKDSVFYTYHKSVGLGFRLKIVPGTRQKTALGSTTMNKRSFKVHRRQWNAQNIEPS